MRREADLICGHGPASDLSGGRSQAPCLRGPTNQLGARSGVPLYVDFARRAAPPLQDGDDASLAKPRIARLPCDAIAPFLPRRCLFGRDRNMRQSFRIRGWVSRRVILHVEKTVFRAKTSFAR